MDVDVFINPPGGLPPLQLSRSFGIKMTEEMTYGSQISGDIQLYLDANSHVHIN